MCLLECNVQMDIEMLQRKELHSCRGISVDRRFVAICRNCASKTSMCQTLALLIFYCCILGAENVFHRCISFTVPMRKQFGGLKRRKEFVLRVLECLFCRIFAVLPVQRWVTAADSCCFTKAGIAVLRSLTQSSYRVSRTLGVCTLLNRYALCPKRI